MVNLVGLNAIYVIGDGLAFSVLDYSEWRIGDDGIKLSGKIKVYSVIVVNRSAIHDTI
jgi:hypothetical protein